MPFFCGNCFPQALQGGFSSAPGATAAFPRRAKAALLDLYIVRRQLFGLTLGNGEREHAVFVLSLYAFFFDIVADIVAAAARYAALLAQVLAVLFLFLFVLFGGYGKPFSSDTFISFLSKPGISMSS